jgi:hypothetical protein
MFNNGEHKTDGMDQEKAAPAEARLESIRKP